MYVSIVWASCLGCGLSIYKNTIFKKEICLHSVTFNLKHGARYLQVEKKKLFFFN